VNKEFFAGELPPVDLTRSTATTVLLKPLWDLNTQHIPVVEEP
jgi:hypothetical protein